MLLSRLMRTVDTVRVNAFFGGRQGGRWAQHTVAAAFPNAAPHAAQGSPPAAREPSAANPAETLRQLTQLHRRG
jgi:hypothetical protein